MLFSKIRFLFARLKGRRSDLDALEKVLAYRFRDRSLLLKALSHRSYLNSIKGESIDSNERLEFLGDSVLNMIVTAHLFNTYPDKREGRLSKMKSLVVSAKVLQLCAQNWDLGRFVLLSNAEAKAGGRERSSILADAFEAVIGAVFVDGGVLPAKRILHAHLMPMIVDVLNDEELMNYKSSLLEYTQSQDLGVPQYRVVSESGPEHKKHFVVSALVREEEWGRGAGMSKKVAEQAAARDALEQRKVLEDSL